MKNVAPWLKIISGLIDIRTQYEDIKKNEESRKVSGVLGAKAIKYDILLIVFVALAAALGMWGASYLNNLAFFFGIILIIIALGCALYIPVFLLFALSCSIKQLKLNKKPIGFIALLLTLLLTAAAVVAVWLVIKKLL